MTPKFERVPKVPHLYKRVYQVRGDNWSTRYYANFSDWKGKRRVFPVGGDLQAAKEALKILEGDNAKRKDFDLEKEEQRKAATDGMTVAEWLDRYIALMKNTRSGKTIKTYCTHLKRLLGSLPLRDVTKVRIMEYKQRRLSEPLIRHGKTVEDTEVMGSIRGSLKSDLHPRNRRANSAI